MDAFLKSDGDVSPGLRLALRQLIDDGVIASAVYKSTTESTNSDAVSDLQSGQIDDALPRLYLADLQTAGRGRQGNAWVSDDDALTLSLVVRFDLEQPSASLLSPSVGVAVARAIEYCCAPCRVALKWPNDICTLSSGRSKASVELRKLGGILIETAATSGGATVIGIGLNLNRTPALRLATSTPPASLSELAGRKVGREDLLVALAESLAESLDSLSVESSELIGQYRSRCALAGKNLTLKQNDRVVSGYCSGITNDGSLELLVEGRRHFFRSGEVQHVRPV